MKLDAVHIILILLVALSAGLTSAASYVTPGTPIYVYVGIGGAVVSALLLAVKSSVLPNVNLSSVRKMSARLGVKVVSLALTLFVCSCALFTRIVSSLTPASAALLSCLNDYADAEPPNVLTIAGATLACGASVEAALPVLIADLTPTDAGVTLAPMSTAHPQRMTRLYALYTDAIHQGFVCVSGTPCSPKVVITVR